IVHLWHWGSPIVSRMVTDADIDLVRFVENLPGHIEMETPGGVNITPFESYIYPDYEVPEDLKVQGLNMRRVKTSLNLRKKADIVEEDWEAQYEGALEEEPTDLEAQTLEEPSKKDLAENPNTPVEVLVELSEDEDSSVRRSVAKNLNTPVEVLVKLSKDKAGYVRYFVAFNPNTPVEVLVELSEDEDSGVRW
ncbi:unnamed protein product, partial [marine sediment metagenome]